MSATSPEAGQVSPDGQFRWDGQQWVPQQFKMTFNSNGYPIPVVNGREYMHCQ